MPRRSEFWNSGEAGRLFGEGDGVYRRKSRRRTVSADPLHGGSEQEPDVGARISYVERFGAAAVAVQGVLREETVYTAEREFSAAAVRAGVSTWATL